ncbi:SPFH domain-containing protein, partial [Streptomyces sp. 900105245]
MSETDATPNTPDVQMPKAHVREFTAHSIGGGLALLLGLIGLIVGGGLIAIAGSTESGGARGALIAAGVVVAICSVFAMAGLNMVAPGEARVVQLFGRYRGTI